MVEAHRILAAIYARVDFPLDPPVLSARAVVPAPEGIVHDLIVDADQIPETAVVVTAVEENCVLLLCEQRALNQLGEVGTEYIDRIGGRRVEDIVRLPAVVRRLSCEQRCLVEAGRVLGEVAPPPSRQHHVILQIR